MDFVDTNCTFAISKRKVERVGLAFLNSKKTIGGTGEQIERSDSAEKLLGAEFVVDINYLKSLDPKEWKDQDHYAVLGLQTLRFDATDDDIRRAYRRMVLQHHPDKRKAKGEEVKQDDDYFTCITKAYEILGTPKTRRGYDSVDPEFDDALPTTSEIESNIYESFNKYFTLNARWSERKNVPGFGDADAKRADVEEFYSFWYDFKSWREFSYLDEEDKEKGQDRDERRWIEKENKVARIKRKKEEMMRIRQLVDLAYNNDKRILKFKNEEKERKLAAKRAKMDAAQAQKAEIERALRETQLAKERADKEAQKRIEQIRSEKEQQKKLLKKERKTLRDKAKDAKYFGNTDKDTLKNMEVVEKICETFCFAELQELNRAMSEKSGKDAFFVALKTADRKIQAELDEINQHSQNRRPPAAKSTTNSDVKEVRKVDIWNNENVQLLIKAVNLFPAGTLQRWDVIASFINQHSSTEGINMVSRDVLNKAKALQSGDFSKNSLKTQANEAAFESFEKSKKDVQTCNDITVGDPATPLAAAAAKSNAAPAAAASKSNAAPAAKSNAAPAAKSNVAPATKSNAAPAAKSNAAPAASQKSSSAGGASASSKNNSSNKNNSGSKENVAVTVNGDAKIKENGESSANAKEAVANNNNINNNNNTNGKPAGGGGGGVKAAPKTWTKEEQALLEQAIKTYPISTADRWERIAECIPQRSKKDCLRRVKELVELVNSKKEAQQAVK